MDKICTWPFKAVEIYENGDVCCCCFSYASHGYTFGNIFENDFDEIWYGKKAVAMRKSVIEHNFRFCNPETCIEIGGNKLFFENSTENLVERPPYPEYISFAYDKTCNCNCVMCRDEVVHKFSEEMRLWDEKIETLFLPMLKNAKVVEMDGSGEIFVSEHSKRLISAIIANYPNIKFNLQTNGILCTEENLRKLNLYDRLTMLNLSVHAANEETYNKIVRKGNFKKVLENIETISKMKKDGKIDTVFLNFVVSSFNYKEMPEFVELAKKFDLTASFFEFRDWGDCSNMCRNYEEYAVILPNHPAHKDFVRTMQNPTLLDEHSVLNEVLFNFIQK